MPPLAPNTVTIERPTSADGDAEDSILTDDDTGAYLTDDETGAYLYEATTTTVATGLRVALVAPSGGDMVVNGQKEIVDLVMLAPTAPVIEHTDLVTDDDTTEAYRIVWVRRRRGLGLDHQVAGLRSVKGGASG